jgi:hypothetical protein
VHPPRPTPSQRTPLPICFLRLYWNYLLCSWGCPPRSLSTTIVRRESRISAGRYGTFMNAATKSQD